MTDSEIAQLCADIYKKHQRALDLIYAHLPDDRLRFREFLEDLVATTPGIQPVYSIKTYIRFRPVEWDQPAFNAGTGWKPSTALTAFEFVNSPDQLTIELEIGPGPDKTRLQLYELARANQPPFKTQLRLGKEWSKIYGRQIVETKQYRELEIEERFELVRQWWAQFLEGDLGNIRALVAHEFPSTNQLTQKPWAT